MVEEKKGVVKCSVKEGKEVRGGGGSGKEWSSAGLKKRRKRNQVSWGKVYIMGMHTKLVKVPQCFELRASFSLVGSLKVRLHPGSELSWHIKLWGTFRYVKWLRHRDYNSCEAGSCDRQSGFVLLRQHHGITLIFRVFASQPTRNERTRYHHHIVT